MIWFYKEVLKFLFWGGRDCGAAIEGNEIVVYSDKLPDSIALRYAWADNPEWNLINSAGLPASFSERMTGGGLLKIN